MISEEYYNFEGCLILFDKTRKKDIARVVCVPKTENEECFVGIVADDDIKVIKDESK